MEVSTKANTTLCAGCSLTPRAVVFLRSPVHLRYQDRRLCSNTRDAVIPTGTELNIACSVGHYLLLGTCNLRVRTIPTRIAMHRIANAKSALTFLDRILHIALIILLICKTWNPEDIVTANGTNLVNNLLEELSAILLRAVRPTCILTVITPHIYRLVGKLKHNIRVVLQLLMTANVGPNLYEILLIFITYRKFFWAYARWAHHHIKTVINGIFSHRNENLIKIFLEEIHIECIDNALIVVLARVSCLPLFHL